MTAWFELNSMAQQSAVRLVDCLIEGTLVALFAGFLLRVRRLASGTRFAVWFSALLAIAALPLLSGTWWAQGTNASPQILSHSAFTLPSSWALYLCGAWALLAVIALMRIGLGVWHLSALRKSLAPIDPSLLDSRVREALERNGAGRTISFCVSDLVRVPTAVGLVKPAIVVPRWLMQELSPAELDQIVRHELAHLRRWDDWTNLAQKLIKSLLFFHPAVWWIEKQVSLEREMACDDVVLAETAKPRTYAECLARMAEKTLKHRSLALAQAALGRIRQTSQRVAKILDGNRPTGSPGFWKAAVPLVAGFAIACVVCVSRAPQLVAFRDSAPNIGVSSYGIASNAFLAPPAIHPVAWNPNPVRPARTLQEKEKRVSASTARASKRNSNRSATADLAEGLYPGNLVGAPSSLAGISVVSGSSTVSTEALFVVVHSQRFGNSPQPVYEIQLWRVLLVHRVNPVNRIPSKQT